MDLAPPDRWRQVEALFAAVFELAPAERVAFLDAHAVDPALRTEVEHLLSAHERAHDFLSGLDTVRAAALVEAGGDQPRAGEAIGPYRVVRRLGRGGMGLVVLAHDPRLDRLVALKLLPPSQRGEDAANRRLADEAKAASALDHPHIATIHEIGDTGDGGRFIAMTYYEGETLRSRIERGPLPVDEALGLALQIADGLGAAHRRGIVHRDIKPENVIVTTDGMAKIVDFGIARVAGRDLAGGSARGTIAYMSPEQTRGEPADARADLWALGVVLYEMLAGVRPFRGSDTDQIAAIRERDPDPLVMHRPGLRRSIAAIVERCLAKDPARRFQSAADLVSALRDARRSAAAVRRAVPFARPNGSLRSLAAAAVLAVVAAGTALALRARDPDPIPAGDASVAVMPFANLGPDEADDYLSDGVSEEVLNALGRIPGLQVTARTSSFAFRDADRDATEIGRALGVRHLLEGSVQRAGDRLRITARLVDAFTGYRLWSESFERPVGDLFAVQDEIARAIAAALSVRFATIPETAVRSGTPASVQAHDLYLRGLHAWNRRTLSGFEQAIGYFDEATRIDPRHARAYAGLANTYKLLRSYGWASGLEIDERARAAALRALELDSMVAESHAAVASTLTSDREFAAAERAFLRAIELSPSYADAHHWYGFLLGILDRTDEALVHLRRAQELDPLSLSVYNSLGRVLVHAGRADLAVDAVRQGIDIDPAFPWTWHTLGSAYVALGKYDEAVAAFERVIERAQGQPGLRATIAAIRAFDGDPEPARALLATIGPGGTLPPAEDGSAAPELDAYFAALLHAALGDIDEAFRWLDAVPWNSEFMFKLRAEPLLRPIRSDPRYGLLLRTLGMES